MLPDTQTPIQSNPVPDAAASSSNRVSKILILVVALVIAATGGGYTGYRMGQSRAKPASDALPPEEGELRVPREATAIAECVEGLGKQFVLPKNIPGGPIYNVYQNKVIGLQYMLSHEEIHNKKIVSNLSLMRQKFDHFSVGELPTGHAGNPTTHFHFDLFLIPAAEAAKITCGSQTTPTSPSHTSTPGH